MRLCFVAGSLVDKVEQEAALLHETVEGAAKVLAEAAATTKTATEASKQASVSRRTRIVPPRASYLLHVDVLRPLLKYIRSIPAAQRAPTQCSPSFLYALVPGSNQTQKDGQSEKGPKYARVSIGARHKAVGFPIAPPLDILPPAPRFVDQTRSFVLPLPGLL